MDIIDKYENESSYPVKVLATSDNHMKKILAINSLMIIAKYLNKDWNPCFNNDKQAKYFITISNGKLLIDYCYYINMGVIVYFRREKLAQQAIELLGEETIKQALSNNY